MANVKIRRVRQKAYCMIRCPQESELWEIFNSAADARQYALDHTERTGHTTEVELMRPTLYIYEGSPDE